MDYNFDFDIQDHKDSIYLLYCSPIAQAGEYIFKYGRTRKPLSRFRQYPMNSILLYFCRVNNCYGVENEIHQVFKKRFKQRLDYGSEFFETNDLKYMVNCIDKLIDHMNQRIDDNDMLITMEKSCGSYLNISIYDDINNIPDDYVDILIKEYKNHQNKYYFRNEIDKNNNINNRVKKRNIKDKQIREKMLVENKQATDKILIEDKRTRERILYENPNKLSHDELSMRDNVMRRAKYLNIDFSKKVQKKKWEKYLINNFAFERHVAYRLLTNPEDLNYKGKLSHQMKKNHKIIIAGNLDTKVKIIKKIENILGIASFDIDFHRDMKRFNEDIEIDDELVNEFKKVFRIRKNCYDVYDTYKLLYYQLIQFYKHIFGNTIYDLKQVTIKGIHYQTYTVNSQILREHTTLKQLC